MLMEQTGASESKLKCYYAHSMHIYGSLQEARDMTLLEKLGFAVINPSEKSFAAAYETWKKANPYERAMRYFEDCVMSCDVVAFRAHIDGKIPSGVGAELEAALKVGIPVIELPSLVSGRMLSLKDTVEYLKLNGQR